MSNPNRLHRKKLAEDSLRPKVTIEKEDIGKIGLEDLVQKNFIKYSHRQSDSNGQGHELKHFTRLTMQDRQKMILMRRAEQNTIERKNQV